MIVEFINNPQSKNPEQGMNFGERMLVLKVSTNLSSQDIFYSVVNQNDISLSVLSVYWHNFKVICNKMPSNWVFKYEEYINYGKRIFLAPKKMAR